MAEQYLFAQLQAAAEGEGFNTDTIGRRINTVEEELVDSGKLAPLTRYTTPEGWDRYWQAVTDEYVRRYGVPVLRS